MRHQLEIRDSQIYELKRLYKESRDAETRNAELIQQLQVELARHEGLSSGSQCNLGMITANSGMIQQQNRELLDRIAQLESQLRFIHISY